MLIDTDTAATQAIGILRPKYAISQLFVATSTRSKSHKALERLVLQMIPVCCTAKTVEMCAYSFESGAPFLEPEGFEFASLETSLSYMAHLAHDPKKLSETFCDDPRPLICLDQIRVTNQRAGGGSSLMLMVFGLDNRPRIPLPQVRLLNASKIAEVCGGYYRPIVTLTPAEKSAEERG